MTYRFKRRNGELVQIQAGMCPNCLSLFDVAVPAPATLVCPQCSTSFPAGNGLALGRIGFDIAYFGWFYGIVDAAEEEKAKKEGREPGRFLLPPPIEFLQQLALLLATGIVRGLGYDLVKAGALRLYRRFSRKPLPKATLDDQVVPPAEAMKRLAEMYDLADQYMRRGEDRTKSASGLPIQARYRLLLEIDRTYGISQKLTGEKRTKRRRVKTRRQRKYHKRD